MPSRLDPRMTRALDKQQMVLLEILRRAAGAPVSYAQLHEAGIEFLASVVSELELAGVAIERWHANTRGEGRLMGVRLDPSCDPYRKLGGSSGRQFGRSPRPVARRERAIVHVYQVPVGDRLVRSVRAARARAMNIAYFARRTASGVLTALSPTASSLRERTREVRVARRGSSAAHWRAVVRGVYTDASRVVGELDAIAAKRWLAMCGLFAATGLVIAVVLAQVSGGGVHYVTVRARPFRHTATVAQRSSRTPTVSSNTHTTASPPSPTGNAPATPVSSALAAKLDAQGHELLQAGRYREAIAVLERTLVMTGEHLQNCLQPASETCLTYAYALYDLGSALRLDGHPAAAVPVLRRRLQIDNQRATVQVQLELALTQTS